MLLLLIYLIGVGLTVWDIRRHEFRDGSRTKWTALVILLGYIGMMFYYYYGIKQKEHYRFRFMEKIKV